VRQDLLAKLCAGGSHERNFTPRAVVRVHCLSRGIPRALEELASLSLAAGAARALEIISPDVVDGIAEECRGPVPRICG
jgi:hypothetical protein